MLRLTVGEKRARDNEGLKFIPGLRLSQHPPEERKDLFMKKLGVVIICKSLHPTEFEGYTIRERFQRMGWEELLNLGCDKIYKRVVIQWVSSLSRNGDELTGMVDGKSYTITPEIVRDVLGVDTRKDLQYTRFNKADFYATTKESKRRWFEACKTVFGLKENAKKAKRGGYEKSNLTPLVHILWQIGVWTFQPRIVRMLFDRGIYHHEICLLHALYTGDYSYSFAHLMIDNIWDMYEHLDQTNIPHGYYISEILSRLGAVSEAEYVEIISPKHRVITKSSLRDYLKFSETSTEYILDKWTQRVTFPKKFIEREAASHLTPTPSSHMAPDHVHQDLDMNPLLTNLQNLLNKQHNEMMTMVTNIQKQMERCHQQRERIEQARERREQARDRREQERDCREQERERRAKIRAHAIIWDIERQRYFYEQEQEQLHKAWNQAYGSNEFQFPRISQTSFHPPPAGSPYYDPTQGDEIPKVFQDIFHDIYGPTR